MKTEVRFPIFSLEILLLVLTQTSYSKKLMVTLTSIIKYPILISVEFLPGKGMQHKLQLMQYFTFNKISVAWGLKNKTQFC